MVLKELHRDTVEGGRETELSPNNICTHMYQDKEHLELSNRIGVTKEVYAMLRQEQKRILIEEKRKISMSKLVCNLIIRHYA